MSDGINYLIDLLNGSDSKTQGISPRKFTEALKNGVEIESEKFTALVEALENRIKRAHPDWSDEQARRRTLSNIGAYALLADHGYETEMQLTASMGGPGTVSEWYDNPKNYRSAMNAFAEYVGVKGPSIRKFLEE